MTSFPKGFVGITCAKMQRLAKVIDENGQLLYQAGRQLQDILNGLQLPSYPGKKVAQIGDEMIRKAPELHNRYYLAVSMDKQGNPFANVGKQHSKMTIIKESDLSHVKAIQQANGDAARFNSAAKSNDPSTSRAQLTALAKSIENNSKDSYYLRTLWSQVDPAVVSRLARILHNQDVQRNADRNSAWTGGNAPPYRPILSAEAKQILAQIGSSLAAQSRQPEGLPRALTNHLLKPPHDDIWSSSMLFKFGPKGTAWDKHLLVEMGRSIYDWRDRTRVIPIPGRRDYAHKQTDTDWPTSLTGLGYFGASADPKVLADLDPTCALLDRLGENAEASRLFMTDPETGYKYTQKLINDAPAVDSNNKHIDLSGHAGAVVKAATHVDQRDNGRASEQAAWAMLNTMAAAAKPDLGQNIPGSSKPDLAPGIRHAVTDASLDFIPDFALAARNPSSNDIQHLQGDPRLPYQIRLGGPTLEEFMKRALQDPEDIGKFHGATLAFLRTSVASSFSHPGMSYVDAAGKLDGLLKKQTSLRRLQRAENKDLALGMAQALLTPGFEKIGTIIIPKKDGFAGDVGGAVRAQGIEALKKQMFPNFAASARTQNSAEYDKEIHALELKVAEAYIDAGRLPNPLKDKMSNAYDQIWVNYPARFWVNGRIELKTREQEADWNSYLQRHGGTYQRMLNDVYVAFGIPTTQRIGG